jgi:ferrous iron transport protein A
MLPLDLLEQDEQARVVEIDGPVETVHRLDEMGLRPDVIIRVIKAGSPCILAIGEIRLSFRPADDLVVLVEPIRE